MSQSIMKCQISPHVTYKALVFLRCCAIDKGKADEVSSQTRKVCFIRLIYKSGEGRETIVAELVLTAGTAKGRRAIDRFGEDTRQRVVARRFHTITTLLQRPIPSKVNISHVSSLISCPRIQSHLLHQAQIEDFGVVPYEICSVCVWMENVTREVVTLVTEFDAFLFRAWIQSTLHGKVTAFAPFISASFTDCLFRWNAVCLRNQLSQVRMLVCHKEAADKAREPTRRGHLPVVRGWFMRQVLNVLQDVS